GEEKERERGGVLMNHYRLGFLPSAVLIDAKGKVAALGHVDEVIRKLSGSDEAGGKKEERAPDLAAPGGPGGARGRGGGGQGGGGAKEVGRGGGGGPAGRGGAA